MLRLILDVWYKMDRKLQEEETAEDIEQLEGAEEEARVLDLLEKSRPIFDELEAHNINPYNRIRTEGLRLKLKERVKDYDLTELEAEVELEEKKTKSLLAERITSTITKIIKPVAVGSLAIGLGCLAYSPVEKWWNASDYALEALSKYDKPTKITDIKEREEVASQLDEIFEEHAKDDESDTVSRDYLLELETRGYPIAYGAKVLDNIGAVFSGLSATNKKIEECSLSYLDFLKEEEINQENGMTLLEITISKLDSIHHSKSDNVIFTAKKFHKLGY